MIYYLDQYSQTRVFASFVIKAILKSFILPLANKYEFA